MADAQRVCLVTGRPLGDRPFVTLYTEGGRRVYVLEQYMPVDTEHEGFVLCLGKALGPSTTVRVHAPQPKRRLTAT